MKTTRRRNGLWLVHVPCATILVGSCRCSSHPRVHATCSCCRQTSHTKTTCSLNTRGISPPPSYKMYILAQVKKENVSCLEYVNRHSGLSVFEKQGSICERQRMTFVETICTTVQYNVLNKGASDECWDFDARCIFNTKSELQVRNGGKFWPNFHRVYPRCRLKYSRDKQFLNCHIWQYLMIIKLSLRI